MKTIHCYGFLSLCLFVCLAAVEVAHTKTYPHLRDGFFAGVGLGFGNAGADISLVENLDRESDGIGNFVFGWAVAQQLGLALEINAWQSQFRGDVFRDVTWTFSLSTITATYFPSDIGFFLRGGFGVGTSSVELTQGVVPVSETKAGPGFLAGAGYEWRVTEKMAIGPQVEFAYLNIEGEITEEVDFFAVTAHATWYW
ncbi:MAG: outer membrane beta-barrel protein [Candidatus Krumholzibacteria bacterium]